MNSLEQFLHEGGWFFREEGDSVLSVHAPAAQTPGDRVFIRYVPLSEASSPSEAEALAGLRRKYPGLILVYEDRWTGPASEATRARIAAHLGRFRSIFARKCEIRRVGADQVRGFLDRCHSYGYSKSKYKYAMYFEGEMVAAATFSGCRVIPRRPDGPAVEAVPLRSYEWISYASLPGCRIAGGMGRMLAAFIGDVGPDEVMSYSDLEWSDGGVYEALGFREAGIRPAVRLLLDVGTMKRMHPGSLPTEDGKPCGGAAATSVEFYSPGSRKWLLNKKVTADRFVQKRKKE